MWLRSCIFITRTFLITVAIEIPESKINFTNITVLSLNALVKISIFFFYVKIYENYKTFFKFVIGRLENITRAIIVEYKISKT